MYKRFQEEREADRLRLEEERRQREEERRQREEERKAEKIRLEEERRQREEERKQREEADKKRQEEWDKKLAVTNKKVAEITDTLGLFAEEQVAPAALRLFADLGMNLKEVMQRVKITNQRREIVAEVDLLLVDDEVSVAVEVKNRLRKDDVDDHIKRLDVLQQHPSRATAQTKLYGAIAAMIADKSLVEYALKKGLFVIVPSGESVELAAAPDFNPRFWEVGPRN